MQIRLKIAPGGLIRLAKGAMSNQSFPFHNESTALVHAPTDRVFAHLDDPMSLSAHMGESSMMMIGSRMSIEVDAGGGRAIGSKVFCVDYDLVFDQRMYETWLKLLPGFTWLTWSSFLLGLVETFLYGIYIGLVFAPLYNVLVSMFS